MEKLADNEVLGVLPEKELELLKKSQNQINHIKFKVGDIESIKYQMLNEIGEIQNSLKIQEQQIIKRYGEKAVINIQTGEVTGPKVEKSFKDQLLDQFKGKHADS